MEQRHSIALALSQEANGFKVNHGKLLQIEHDWRSGLLDEGPNTLQMLHLHSAYQANDCSLTIAVLFDFPAHLRTMHPSLAELQFHGHS